MKFRIGDIVVAILYPGGMPMRIENVRRGSYPYEARFLDTDWSSGLYEENQLWYNDRRTMLTEVTR